MVVVETPGFLHNARPILTGAEREQLVDFLAWNPETGVVIPETGGVRKLRWAAKGKGKSGGVRAIYYVRNESMPLFLLNVFAKNEKANLSKAERNELKRSVPRLIADYRRSPQ